MWTDGSSCNKGLGSCDKLSHLLPIKLTHRNADTSFATQGIGERRKERGRENRTGTSSTFIPDIPTMLIGSTLTLLTGQLQAIEAAVGLREVCTWKTQLGGLCCLFQVSGVS